MPLIPVGTLDNLDTAKIARLRARLQQQRMVYDAKTGALYEAPPQAGGRMSVQYTATASDEPASTALAPAALVKWQSWAAMAGGVLLGLLVAGLIWWYNQPAKRRPRRKIVRAS